MEIGTKGQYGLEALVYMASFEEGTCFSIHSIAIQREISEKYLEHIFALLKKDKILNGRRGKLGGYEFLIPPRALTVFRVLECLTGSLEPVKCIHSISCSREKECKSKPIWESMYGHMKEILENMTIEQLANEYRRRL